MIRFGSFFRSGTFSHLQNKENEIYRESIYRIGITR